MTRLHIAALAACLALPGAAGTAPPSPADPSAFWIWADKDEADQWAGTHPGLCVRPVPDGFATERCPEPNRLRIHVGSEAEAKRISDQLGGYFDCLEYIPATGTLQDCEP